MSQHPRALRCVLLVLLAAYAAPIASAIEDEVRAATEILERHARDPFEQKERETAIRHLGRIGGEDAVVALFAVYGDPFAHLADHATSALIATLRGDRAEASRAAIVRRGLPHRDPLIRRAAATAIGLGGGPGAVEALAGRVEREKDPATQAAIVRALGRLGQPAAAATPRVLRLAPGTTLLALSDAYRRAGDAAGEIPHLPPRSGDALARAAAVHLDALGGRLHAERVAAILQDAADEPRMALTETIADGGALAPHLSEAWDSLLADPSWRVRAAAIGACTKRRDADAVGRLLERLGAETGRLHLDVLLALQALTGQTIDDDAQLWRAWWAEHRDGFRMRDEARPARAAPAPLESTTRAFFRLPITSTRVAFLIDCSGSMRDPALPGRPEAGAKFDRARAELARTLEALDAETQFDVFLYRYPSEFPPRPRMTRALGRLRPASKANARKAVRWLAGEDAKGWGAFYDALAAIAGEEVDTLYFLTDGRPSRGTYDRDFRLLDEFDRLNRFRRLAIHTILVGKAKADRAFLQELARRTGGLFVDATQE